MQDQKPYVPKVSFLADEDMLKAYQESIESHSRKARDSLNIFRYENGVIKGSNLFANIKIASLFPQEYRLALPSEVLQDLELNPDFFRENYEDLGLVLRTNGDSYDPNDYNAKNLYKQLNHRGIKPSEELSYGLVQLLTDETQIIQAPELSHLNDRKRFSRADERGIPIFDGKGERIFYSGQGGLGRFCLDGGLGLYSGWYRDLADSDAVGRVAVVKNFHSGNSR